jgi:hypothetical protein
MNLSKKLGLQFDEVKSVLGVSALSSMDMNKLYGGADMFTELEASKSNKCSKCDQCSKCGQCDKCSTTCTDKSGTACGVKGNKCSALELATMEFAYATPFLSIA